MYGNCPGPLGASIGSGLEAVEKSSSGSLDQQHWAEALRVHGGQVSVDRSVVARSDRPPRLALPGWRQVSPNVRIASPKGLDSRSGAKR